MDYGLKFILCLYGVIFCIGLIFLWTIEKKKKKNNKTD